MGGINDTKGPISNPNTRSQPMGTLHLFVLSGFAISQPLFDLLANNPDFFVARHSIPIDILLFILTLTLLPFLLLFLETLTGLISPLLRWCLRLGFVGVLVALIFLPALKKLTALPDAMMVLIAVFIGIAGATAYARIDVVRRFLTVLSPVIVVFPILFVFASPVRSIVLPKATNQEKSSDRPDNAPEYLPPFFMLIFDELPVISLMNKDEEIDASRYPNFAALVNDAYWFRNATTVADQTLAALPAVLTGKYPLPDALATTTVFPDNLFTWLGDAYDMNVTEIVSLLCPPTLCRRPDGGGVRMRYQTLVQDLSIVYVHFLLPESLNQQLPSISAEWKNFGRGVKTITNATELREVAIKNIQQDRQKQFDDFVASIQYQEGPGFFFFHSMLPHVPFDYLPSGKVYGFGADLEGLNHQTWTSDKEMVRRSYQRHLLQVQFVDTLLGRFVAELKRLQVYDDSIIVVISDHGASFRPENPRRVAVESNSHEIMSVPLFLKIPNQTAPVTSDEQVELIDIVPTIADILGSDVPWSVDGRSLISASDTSRSEKRIYYKNATETLIAAASDVVSRRKDSVRYKHALFNDENGVDGLFKTGNYRDWIGKHLDGLPIGSDSEIRVEIDQTPFFARIDVSSSYVPARITGQVILDKEQTSEIAIGIGVNGVLWAAEDLAQFDAGIAEFRIIVPESAFQAGGNQVDALIIRRNSNQGTVFERAISGERHVERYDLVFEEPDKEWRLLTHDGQSIPVVPDGPEGWLDQIRKQQNVVRFAGWATEAGRTKPVEKIVIFLDGEFFFADRPNYDRLDVKLTEPANKKLKQKVGFNYHFPLSLLKDKKNSIVKAFAVSHTGVATELQYNDEFQWSIVPSK